MHELSLAGAVIDTAERHAAGRRVTAVYLRVGDLRQVVPDSLAFYFEHVARGTLVRGRALEQEPCPQPSAAPMRLRAGSSPPARWAARRAPGRRSAARAAARRTSRWSAGNEFEVESIEVGGASMHRVKVRVVEDALDANNTIARANRDDFDRHGVDGRQPHERARRRQDDAARARARAPLGDGIRVGVLEGDVQGSIRRRPRSPRCTCPVTQINTDPGFGGECHLDANMVRSALPAVPLARDRPAGDRERRQPRLPGRVPRRRGRARDGRVGHRGRGQAAQVPAHVPHLRPRAGQQARPAAAPRGRPRASCSPTSTPSTPASRRMRRQRAHGRGRRGVARAGWPSAWRSARRR